MGAGRAGDASKLQSGREEKNRGVCFGARSADRKCLKCLVTMISLSAAAKTVILVINELNVATLGQTSSSRGVGGLKKVYERTNERDERTIRRGRSAPLH